MKTQRHIGKLLLVFGLAAARFNDAHAAPFPIATNSAVEFSLSSAFDGTNYLVAIQGDQVGTSPSRFNLEAQRFSQTGALLGPKISLGLTDSEPFVAFDGTNYLVVSELRDAGGADGIYGRFVNTLGNPVGTAFTISHGTGTRNPDSVIFDTTNYLVTWDDGRRVVPGPEQPGDHDIYAQRVSTTGQLLGGEFKISGAAGKDSAVAFDGTNFLVIWRDDVNDTDIYGRLVSPSGTFVTSEFVIDANALPSDNPGAVIYDGTRYVVIINDQVGGLDNEWDLFARFVTTAGSVLINRVTITDAPGGQRIPFLAFDGSNYLVSWSDGMGTTNSNIKFKFFNMAGQPMGSEFAVFPAQGTNLPIVSGVFFDGKQFVTIGNVGVFDTNFNITACDVYGAFIPKSTERPQLDVAGPLVGAQFPLRLTGTPGITYAIQTQTNLGPTDWMTLVTISLTNSGSFNFTDTSATGARRFYRAVKQ